MFNTTTLLVALSIAGAAGQAGSRFAAIASGDVSRISEPREVVVRTAGEWRALWTQHAGDTSTAPVIDFDRDAVVAIFAGVQRSAGFSIAVTSAVATGNELVITYELRRPPADALTAQMLTQPFQIVRVTAPPEMRIRVVSRPN
jgi:hypothetical protein